LLRALIDDGTEVDLVNVEIVNKINIPIFRPKCLGSWSASILG
jgi:hypothetical protein